MAVIGAVMVPHPPLIIPEVGRGEEKAIQKNDRCLSSGSERDRSPSAGDDRCYDASFDYVWRLFSHFTGI